MVFRRMSAKQIERFKELAWPYLPVLLRSATYLTRDVNDAEDLVQEVMIKAMKAIDSYQEGTNIKAWLMTILRRAHIDRYRAEKHHQDELSLDAVVEVAVEDEFAGVSDEMWDSPEQLLERFEDQAVIDALKALPVEIRYTLMLVDVEQFDHEHASRILEIPVGTVKSRAHRGRKMLRELLSEAAKRRGWLSNVERKTHAR